MNSLTKVENVKRDYEVLYKKVNKTNEKVSST